MVAVCTVFGLELPVAVVGVGGGSAQYFEAFWGLVNQHVNDGTGVAEVLFQRNDIIVEGAEEEATVGLELRNATQIVGAVGAEILWVGAFFFVLDLEQCAVVAECPAVEWAGQGGAVVSLATAEHGATVRTRVDQAVECAVLERVIMIGWRPM